MPVWAETRMVQDPHLDPSDALWSRGQGVSRANYVSARDSQIQVYDVATPKTTENIKLSDSLQLQLQEDESVTIATAIE